MFAPMARAGDVYRDELAKIGAEDGRVVCVEAMASNASHPFDAAHPDRFFLVGGVEAAAVRMVGGLVTAGFRVFVCGLTALACGRGGRLPQMTPAYLQAGATVVTSQDQADLDLSQTMPRVLIAAPSGPSEIRAVLHAAVRSGRPHHIRIGSDPSGAMADWDGAPDGDIPSVTWDVDGVDGDHADGRVCLVSIGDTGTKLGLAAREKAPDSAHAHIVYLDETHLAAAAGELARRHDRFLVLGGHAVAGGVEQVLSRMLPGCRVVTPVLSGEFETDLARVLTAVEGLRRWGLTGQ